MFILFHYLIVAVLVIPIIIISENGNDEVPMIIFGSLLAIYVLGTLIPTLGVTVRRLHDTDRSGWVILTRLIPYVGGFIMLFFTVSNGTKGANKYGQDPKGENIELDDFGVEEILEN